MRLKLTRPSLAASLKTLFKLSVFLFLVGIFGSRNVPQTQAVDGEVTYTGTNTTLTGDDVGAGPFNLGFTFDFYGTNYTQTYININGTINFAENYSRYSNVPLATAKSGTNISDNSIYAFWDDLNTNPSGGSGNRPIYYATVGTAPNRKFISQWTNIYFHGTTVQMGTFQIILYEGSNEVQIQYRDLLGNASQPSRELGNSATIGIRKDNTYRNQYSHDTASITQGQAIRYTPNGANSYSVNTNATYDLVYLAPAGAPTSPTLVTPTDGTTGVTLAPSFEWLPVESATSYRVLVSTVSNFSTTVVDQTTTGTSYTHGSNLATNTTYYWRVQAINSNGSSLSPTRSFTTASAANTAPNTPASVLSSTLLEGASIATTSGKTISMYLTDNDTDEQVRYRLQIATDSSFNSLVVDYRSAFGAEGEATYTFGQSGGTYLVGSSGTVLANDEYYVRLRTEDDSAASSSWYTSGSVAFTLEQNAPPNTPTSLGSAHLVDGTATSSTQPSLTFSLSDSNGSNTLRYTVEIDDNADFASPVVQYQSALAAQGSRTFTVGQAGGSGTYSAGGSGQELGNGSYYWRVRATDNIDDSSSYATANSGAVAFIVNNTVPSIDNLGATVLSSSSARINWDTDEATSSQVEYGLVTSYGFQTAVSDTSPRVTTHEVTLTSLEKCARYFYRVKSVNNASTQVVSPQNTFTTPGCAVSSVIGGGEEVISTSGGNLEFENESTTARLEIPASFASESTQFQINILDKTTSPEPPATQQLVAGNVFNLVAVTESGTILETFDAPVTFSITYSDATKQAYQATTLDVYKYNTTTGTWEKKNCSNDVSTNIITCSLPSFSIYGVFGVPASAGNSSENNPSSSSAVQSCNPSFVLSRPDLFQLTPSGNSVTLYFVPSSGGATEYVIEYGLTPDANQHSVTFSHASTSGAVPYTINSLNQHQIWYFKVRGLNGCVYSDWSTTKSVFVGLPLEIAPAISPELDLPPEPAETEISAVQPEEKPTYTVRIKVVSNEEPIKNAKIVLTQTQQEVETDENGFATFEQIQGGLHRFKIVSQAYASEREIEVGGEDAQFDVAINLVTNKPFLSTRGWLVIITGILMCFSVILWYVRRKKTSTQSARKHAV